MRRRDWQQRFAAFGIERRGVPFAWGSNDCCLFAADAVLALTGVDPAQELRGAYDDAARAMRLVEDRGGLHAIACAALGQPVIPAMATVGDVVLVVNADRELLAICNGVNAIGPGKDGIAVMGMEAALAAWKV